MSALPITTNPAADAEAHEDALEFRASQLDAARELWADIATVEMLDQHAEDCDWKDIARIVLDLAAYRIDYAQATERAGQVIDAIAAKAVRKLPQIPAERAKFLSDYVEQLR